MHYLWMDCSDVLRVAVHLFADMEGDGAATKGDTMSILILLMGLKLAGYFNVCGGGGRGRWRRRG